MVHALLECWRVLEPEGVLIDLRPFHSKPALEIITADGIFVPGHVDDSGCVADDIASSEAIAAMVRQGYFALQKQDSFQFANYWDTLDGLLEHADEKWRDFACIPPSVVAGAWRCIAGANGRYRVRTYREMHIAVYQTQALAVDLKQ